MKNKTTLLIATLLTSTLALHAGDGHHHSKHPHSDHHHAKKQAGPNGGRIITTVHPHLELFMTKDRTLQITPLDKNNKAIPLAQQSVTLIGGDRSNPTRMTFIKKDNILLSDKPVPKGNGLPIILQIKNTPDSKTIIEKLYLNLNNCSGCAYKEYACTCNH